VLAKAEYSAFESTLNSPIVSYRNFLTNSVRRNAEGGMMMSDGPADHIFPFYKF